MRKPQDKIEGGHYLNKYFTQFPNIIDDAELDPYEFRLLIHYYRVGECWEGVRTTAKKCKMSPAKVSTVRKQLEEKNYIEIELDGLGGVTISVVDKARENCLLYEHPPVHDIDATCSPSEKKRSRGEHKNNQLRITQEEAVTYGQLIIKRLNEVRGQYGIRGEIRVTKQREQMIQARMKETPCETVDAMAAMFAHRCSEWKGTKFEKFIRVETLFQASKFVGYMEQAAAQPEKDWTKSGITESDQPTQPGLQSW